MLRVSLASKALALYTRAVNLGRSIEASPRRCRLRLLRAPASTPPGMPGTHPPIFWLGDVNGNTPPQYYYVLSDIADQYWLPSVRSASSRFHSAIRRHQFASVPSHTGTPHPIRWFVPPTLNSPRRRWLRDYIVERRL